MINKNHGHFVTISSNSALIDLPLISSYASFKVAQVKLLETLREELAANGIDGIKTTIVYPSILTGGIANGFEDSYEMTKDVMVTGVQAAKSITHGILKNKDVIYIPKIHRLFSLIKFIFSGRLLGKFVQTKAKINPKFLKLKPKIQ
ncbi:unnamed protein product [Brachionus calyciflorus]|uniref:Uncharacterized protein n=1 Tax=Brachionus calyciflorus TaxID=104777 RepID=A0A813MB13_9BILA|nr:unnamed protein product [Brachionus calyciflorus]